MIVLGRISAPFGVQGWVRIHPFADDPVAWAKLPQWWLADSADVSEQSWRAVKLADKKVHGDGLIVRLEGVATREGAEALEGQFIGVPREALPDVASGEYYWADLIGLSVFNQSGVSLGIVTSLIETGANHVLVVTEGKQERLLPFVEHVVKEVSVTAGRISVDWEADW
jgi:16S rRNA processing protein RimM